MKRETIIWIVLLAIAGAYLAYRATTAGNGLVYVQRIDGVEVNATVWQGAAGMAEPSTPRTIGLWIAAFFTLCIMSFVYKDNPFYKVAESVVVGVSAGYWMVVAFWRTVVDRYRAVPRFYVSIVKSIPTFFGPVWKVSNRFHQLSALFQGNDAFCSQKPLESSWHS